LYFRYLKVAICCNLPIAKLEHAVDPSPNRNVLFYEQRITRVQFITAKSLLMKSKYGRSIFITIAQIAYTGKMRGQGS